MVVSDFDVRLIALELAVKIHEGTGVGYSVVTDATNFENYLQQVNKPQLPPATGSGQQITYTGGAASAAGAATSVSPANMKQNVKSSNGFTSIELMFTDQFLDDLEAESFNLIDEISNHLSQFNRVVHLSDGSSLDIEIDVTQLPKTRRGNIQPAVKTTSRP